MGPSFEGLGMALTSCADSLFIQSSCRAVSNTSDSLGVVSAGIFCKGVTMSFDIGCSPGKCLERTCCVLLLQLSRC